MAMTAANIRLDEIDDDGVDSNSAPEDHLATTKMPAIGQRPLAPRVPSAPPSPPPIVSAPAAGSSPTIPPPPLTIGGPLPSMPPPLFPRAGEGESASEVPVASKPPHEAPRVAPSSWWRALLASTMPPALGVGKAAVAQSARARLAAVAAGLGVLSFVVAFAVGFRGPPADLLMSSTVAGSIVIAHAIMGVGLLGVGVGLLRAAERLAYPPASREREREDD